MNTFMIPSTIRKVADTLLPMMPPTLENAPNFDETAAAVEATTMEVMTTMLDTDQFLEREKVRVGFKYVECPSEKNVPTVTGRWPAAMRRRVMRSIACLYQRRSL